MKGLHPFIAIACMVIVTAGMKAAAPVLNPILLATLFAVSLVPLVTWQMRKGLKPSVAIVISILVVIIGGLILIAVLGTAVARIVQNMPSYQDRLTELFKGVIDFLAAKGIDMSDIRSLEAFSPSNMAKMAVSLFGDLLSLFGTSVLVLLLVVFFLIEFTTLRIKLDTGRISADSLFAQFLGLGSEVRKYVSITAYVGFLTAVGNVILLIILGVDYPILWGFISFLMNFIPNIGFFISLIPPAFFALIESGGIYSLIVIVGFIVINAVAENIIKPKFMGEELDMSILLIFLSLIFWSWVLGPTGAILAIPLTMTLRKIWEIMTFHETETPVEPATQETQKN